MHSNILICDRDHNRSKHLHQKLTTLNFNTQVTASAKEAQLLAHSTKLNAIILDINIQDLTSFDCIAYINLNFQSTKVILTYEDDSMLTQIGLSNGNANILGINALLKWPYDFEQVAALVTEGPKEISKTSQDRLSSGHKHLDSQMTSIPILEFHSGNITIVDLYLRLGSNRYVKIMHRGDGFLKHDVEDYKFNKNVEYLYFQTKDRKIYLAHINSYIEKYLKITNPSSSKLLDLTKNLITKYVDEIYTKGLNPEIRNEGIRLCENMYGVLKKRDVVGKYLLELEKSDPQTLGYIFLTSIFSSIIATNIEWAGKMTHQYVLQGAMLHDIGLMRVPDEVKVKKLEDLNSIELETYKSHVTEGYQILSEANFSQQVMQIVFQHHEWVNGEGYPNNLSGIRIFPLAKVVSFASDFAQFIIAHKYTPLEGLQDFLSKRVNINRYDPTTVRAFFRGFTD